MGEQTGNLSVMGYAASWLVWIFTELGRFDDALAYAARAQSIFRRAPVDPYVQVNSLAGMGYALWHRGERKRVFAVGRKLLRIGWRHADSRSRVMGYCCIGWSRLIAGDGARSSACFRKAVAVSDDPWYSVFPRLALCYGLISEGRLREAESLIGDIIVFSRERGAEFAGTPAKFFRGILLISDGTLTTGLSMLERQLATWEKNGSRLRYALCGCILAEIYARMACRPAERRPARWLRHIGIFLKIVPSASRKASMCFARCIQAAEEMGADGVVGRAYLNWGRMRQYQGRREDARRCFDRAAGYFRKCGATSYIEQAQEARQTAKSDL
jgi:tetratricopeptide (TPR) repeat protein